MAKSKKKSAPQSPPATTVDSGNQGKSTGQKVNEIDDIFTSLKKKKESGSGTSVNATAPVVNETTTTANTKLSGDSKKKAGKPVPTKSEPSGKKSISQQKQDSVEVVVAEHQFAVPEIPASKNKKRPRPTANAGEGGKGAANDDDDDFADSRGLKSKSK
ncbi:hypothetical protein HK102_003287 [Quaeritorhiza haematococci]|nr:hypothetical protein HK102_003287 [Quaeritorhiza haematococci]